MSAKSTRNESKTSRSRTDWARLREPDDRRIDYADIPDTSPEFWVRARLVVPSRKVPVSLRIDEDVLAWFKQQGSGYQTRMNAVLRAYVDSHASAVRERPARRYGPRRSPRSAPRRRA